MAEPALVEDAWQRTQKTCKELQAIVKGDKFSFDNALPTLLRYRTQSDGCTFLNLRYARANKIEAKLWDVHVTINQKFRKILHSFKNGEGKRRLVEQRKMAKQYIKFIKSSQRYYREYIAKLAATFGLPELDTLAGVVNTDGARALFPTGMTGLANNDREIVLLSYHETLIRLGDLSRYRETEITTKERNWGPAVGYYNLASALRPSSGASHNQLAAMALADKHEFRAVYHLYRAIVVQDPFATAKANLERELKSVRKLSDGGLLNMQSQGGGVADLLDRFTRLHAYYYNNLHTPATDELENDVLARLALNLRERKLEGSLPKLVLTNMAAEYVAGAQKGERPQPYYLFQRINLRMFSAILHVLKTELQTLDLETMSQELDKLTVATRHILPSLRLYGSWIASQPELIEIGGNLMSETRIAMWQDYTTTLTLLAATFRVDRLPLVEYMLQEDEDTVGFMPLESERAYQRYCFLGTSDRKPGLHSKGVQRHHPNHEMLSRVRDVLTDGVKLVADQNHPLRLCKGTFIFGDDEIEEEQELAGPEVEASLVEPDTITATDEATPDDADSGPGEDAMKHMVDDIVGPEDEDLWTPAQKMPQTDTSVLKPTPTTVSNDITDYGVIGTLTAQELVQQMRASRSPTSPSFQGKLKQPASPRPHLPSISPSPFTPIPGELDSISPIAPRRPSGNLSTPKPVYSISTDSEAATSSIPFTPIKYASSPVQARTAHREDLKRARTTATMGRELSWGMGEHWLPNGQG